MPGRPIFRETALEAYRRGTEKDFVPRFVTGPIVACRWLLLILLVGVAVLAWWVRVPTYVSAGGVIVGGGELRPAGAETAAVLFLPPEQAVPLRVGRPVYLRVASGASAQGTVAEVEPGVISPDEARERYPIPEGSDLITRSSVAVVVRLDRTPPAAARGGTPTTARVEIGSQRLLALVPGLGSLGGGGS